MQTAKINDCVISYLDEGPRDGQTLMFSNSLGSDMRVWEPLLSALPDNLRIIRYDLRGHGGSEVKAPPYYMGDLVRDAGDLLDHLGVKDVIFVGLSIGGLIGQGLAAERPDLIRGLVLSNTAAKIGNESTWGARIGAIRANGLEGIADDILARWFSKSYLRDAPEDVARWRKMLTGTPQDGYIGCCEAIAETDLIDSTARLNVPTLVIAGSEDGATPPDLVRDTADLIADAEFHILRKAGHIPCVEQPEALSQLLTAFIDNISAGAGS